MAVFSDVMEVDSVDISSYAVGDITSARVAAPDFENCKRILDSDISGAYLCSCTVYLY